MLQEKPDKLLLSSIESFEIEPDLLTLRRIEEVMTKTNHIRSSKIEDLNNRINNLKNDLNNYQNEIKMLTQVSGMNYDNLKQLGDSSGDSLIDTENVNIFGVMNSKAEEMDNMKLTLAKNLNDLESQINSLYITRKSLLDKIEQLNQESENIVTESVISHPDSKSIKIKIYQSLGIDLSAANEDKNKQDEIIIYSKESNLSSVLKIDEKYSDYFVTNYLWERIQGL